MPRSTLTSSCCKPWKTGLVARLLCFTLTLFFHVTVGLVALIGLANFSFPLVNDYKGLIEKEISTFLGNAVTIGNIRVDRTSAIPRWLVSDLQLAESSGDVPIHIQQVALILDWYESLRTLRLQPADIEVQGAEFTLRQAKNALPDVQGLKFPLPGLKNTVLKTERKSPIRVAVKQSFVHWMDIANRRTLTLNDLSFWGEFLPDAITLQAEALFPPQIGKSLAVDAVLKQTGMDQNQAQWSGELNTRAHIFNIAALPSPLLKQWGVEKGALKLDAKIKTEANKPLFIRGEGEVEQLSLMGTQQLPAIHNINATFKADNKNGVIDLKIDNSAVNYPQWFDKPIAIDKLNAQIKWLIKENGWLWKVEGLEVSNKDIHASGEGNLKLLKQKAPDLDLKVNFASQRIIDNVKDYIPSVLVDGTEHWLKTAIVAGFVPKGEFILQGNPADFPFQKKKGVFDIRFDITKGILAYLPEWPEAREVEGELRFHNAGMTSQVKSARIMNLDVFGGEVDIPDMLGETHLLLNLKTQGDLKEHMNYLQSAPIGRSLQDFMQVADFQGKSNLDLKLDVPLDAPVLAKKGVSVDGWVKLLGNTFSLPEYEQTFSDLKGQVHFNQVGVDTQQTTATYRGEPVIIQASTHQESKKIKVNLKQKNALNSFLPASVSVLSNYLQGKTPISVDLNLPAFTADEIKTKGLLQIEAVSDLQDIAIQLPAPFTKTKNSILPTKVNLTIPVDSKLPWQAAINLESLLAMDMQLAHKSKVNTAIGIALGKDLPVLPINGVNITGNIPQIDLWQWRNLALPKAYLPPHEATLKDNNLQITAQVSIDNLTLGKESFGKTQLQLQSADVLKANIQAPNLQATVALPLNNITHGQINLNGKNINLGTLGNSIQSGKTNKAASILPVDLPSLQISCQYCRKGDLILEKLVLNLQRQGKDLRIRQLDIQTDNLWLSANKGQWSTNSDGKATTQLVAKVHSSEVGKLLADKNNKSDLQGGELNVLADIQWDGAPFDFALNKITGKGRATLQQGSITAVDPGVGRVLGLLDLKLLSRRLALDFHDITTKGFVFDQIAGDFQLKQGIISTQNTIIQAPILTAGIKGESDLVRKTHHQTITVIPNLSSTLPLVGTVVAGVGGGIAAALFNEAMNRSAEEKLQGRGGLRYRVTGSWDDPEINGSGLLRPTTTINPTLPEEEPAVLGDDPPG